MGFVNLTDLLEELGATSGLGAGWTLGPGVVAASRDLERVAKYVDRERALMVANEGKSHGCSFAKKAVAFFKISRSMRSRLFSARSRSFSRLRAARLPDG